jgi:hypothetical protein
MSKTGPLLNSSVTTNVMISRKDAEGFPGLSVSSIDKDTIPELQYSVVAARRVTDGKTGGSAPQTVVTTKQEPEHFVIGVAHGPGHAAENPNYRQLAIVTHGPASVHAAVVKTDANERLAPGMLLYPMFVGGAWRLATEKYAILNMTTAQRNALQDAKNKIERASGNADIFKQIIAAYYTILRPFAIVSEFRRGSDYVQIIIGTY